MTILIMGLGFVGLTTALGFAEKGHTVFGFDTDPNKAEELKTGKTSMSEPDLKSALSRHINKSFAVTDDPAAAKADAIFICVGTPCGENGRADLCYLYSAVDMLDKSFDGLIVVKSTVPPGTTQNEIIPYIRGRGITASVANNPEFLREGYCWEDFINPDRIVCGVEDSADIMREIYRDFNAPIVITSLNTAEFIKYLSNTMLASMISFSNEMSVIANAIGNISIKQAFETLHMDKRWHDASMNKYVYPGCGFGGYCLPKDLEAMIAQAQACGLEPALLKSVKAVNHSMPDFWVNQLTAGGAVGILGLSFKPGSDDVRDSPSAKIISLLAGKCSIYAYDPMANAEFQKAYDFPVVYCESADEVCKRAKTVMIATAWTEFRGIDKRYPDVRFVDGRYML
jgi:UDPglucose 6-dehydrogenase